MSAKAGPDAGGVTRTVDTWCPLDGEITAELRGGAFRCPTCGLKIPKRILNYGPRPEDRERTRGGGDE